MSIIIMSCSGDHWYRDKIGKVYNVISALPVHGSHMKYSVKDGRNIREISDRDCEVI